MYVVPGRTPRDLNDKTNGSRARGPEVQPVEGHSKVETSRRRERLVGLGPSRERIDNER